MDIYWKILTLFFIASTLVFFHGWRQAFSQQNEFHHSIVYRENDEPITNRSSCHCPSVDRPIPVIRSTCSQPADERGSNQSVISYSLFGHPSDDDTVRLRYFSAIRNKADQVRQFYPGWIMRIYHNLTDSQMVNYLCQLECYVDLCHVDRIRTDELSAELIQRLNPRMWRFLVMVDPLVDRFLSRDIDSEIIPREVAAVQQWLNSNYTFHVMRDHPSKIFTKCWLPAKQLIILKCYQL